MGFNLYGLGNIKPCWVENGVVSYELPYSGKVFKYKSALDCSIPKQCNLFISKNVAFYLQDNDNFYVGRYDGFITIYRKSDKMMVGLREWEAPSYPPICHCGFYGTATGRKVVYLDTRDQITLYVDYRHIEAKLSKPIGLDFASELSAVTVLNDLSENEWYIVDKEGDYASVDAWNIQSGLREPNCTKFL